MFNGYYILSSLSSHKICRIKFGQKNVVTLCLSHITFVTKMDSFARKTALEFEKELQLNTKSNI